LELHSILNLHPSEDLIEIYIMGHLGQPDKDVLEVHLLLCDPCRRLCAEEEKYVKTIKAAFRATKRPFLEVY
jgi:anti-sigma factor ChrR (cupin superfamily)